MLPIARPKARGVELLPDGEGIGQRDCEQARCGDEEHGAEAIAGELTRAERRRLNEGRTGEQQSTGA